MTIEIEQAAEWRQEFTAWWNSQDVEGLSCSYQFAAWNAWRECKSHLLEWERGKAEPVYEVNVLGLTRSLKQLTHLPDGVYQLYTTPPPAPEPAAQDMVSVPRKITEEMAQAYYIASGEHISELAYSEMLSAAPAAPSQGTVSVPREPVAWEYQLHGSICVEYSDRPPSLVPDIENYDYRPLIYAAPAAPSQDALDAVFLPRSILVQGPVYLEIGTMKISSRSLMEAINAAMREKGGA